jgi:hypothetical protein
MADGTPPAAAGTDAPVLDLTQVPVEHQGVVARCLLINQHQQHTRELETCNKMLSDSVNLTNKLVSALDNQAARQDRLQEAYQKAVQEQHAVQQKTVEDSGNLVKELVQAVKLCTQAAPSRLGAVGGVRKKGRPRVPAPTGNHGNGEHQNIPELVDPPDDCIITRPCLRADCSKKSALFPWRPTVPAAGCRDHYEFIADTRRAGIAIGGTGIDVAKASTIDIPFKCPWCGAPGDLVEMFQNHFHFAMRGGPYGTKDVTVTRIAGGCRGSPALSGQKPMGQKKAVKPDA